MLVVNDGAVVTHAFEGDEIALRNVAGIEADGSSALSIGPPDFGGFNISVR